MMMTNSIALKKISYKKESLSIYSWHNLGQWHLLFSDRKFLIHSQHSLRNFSPKLMFAQSKQFHFNCWPSQKLLTLEIYFKNYIWSFSIERKYLHHSNLAKLNATNRETCRTTISSHQRKEFNWSLMGKKKHFSWSENSFQWS
jgi:hypothetical protein